MDCFIGRFIGDICDNILNDLWNGGIFNFFKLRNDGYC